jgi:hypothetical protein
MLPTLRTLPAPDPGLTAKSSYDAYVLQTGQIVKAFLRNVAAI